MKKLPLLALVILCGCAKADTIYLPDGSSGYHITCDNPMESYAGGAGDCIKKAGEICGANGYQIYDQSGHVKNEDSQTPSAIAALNGSNAKTGKGMSEPPKSIFIKCRSNDAPLRLAPVPAAGPVEPVPPQFENSRPVVIQGK